MAEINEIILANIVTGEIQCWNIVDNEEAWKRLDALYFIFDLSPPSDPYENKIIGENELYRLTHEILYKSN